MPCGRLVEAMDTLIYNPPGPVAERFHLSSGVVRGLMGPVGSGKSSTACVELFLRACQQEAYRGIRETRWLVIRNTYPELVSTTLKTWGEWFPFARTVMGSPITSKIEVPLPDGTVVRTEAWFLAMDNPADLKKLKSLEVTGAWLNEAVELDEAVFQMARQRCRRFPPAKRGGPTWHGVIMDTNPCDDDHWYYRFAEQGTPEGWEFLRQPGGLKWNPEKLNYEPNPEAENIANLPGGYEYYLNLVAGNTREWCKVFLEGSYGTTAAGKPVFPEYADDIHCRTVEAVPNVPLILGFDFGLTPAVAICQLTPRGQFRVVDEVATEDMGIERLLEDELKPLLQKKYSDYAVEGCGDPAGVGRSQTDEKTVFDSILNAGIPIVPAASNDLTARLEAVRKYLRRMVDGQPAFAVNPRCGATRKAMNGAYCFERKQKLSGFGYSDRPNKGKYSHIADALQYAAMYTEYEVKDERWNKPMRAPKIAVA